MDWAQFLARHDLIWNRMPSRWREGAPFLGNGRTALHCLQAGDALRIGVDNTQIYDRRDRSYGWAAYARARYTPGAMNLQPNGQTRKVHLRQDLYNAEWRGTITTDLGQIAFRAFVHTDRPLIVIETEASEGERGFRWTWQPGAARTSRPTLPVDEAMREQYRQRYGRDVKLWEPNPAPELRESGDVRLCVQKLLAGGGYATAWLDVETGPGRRTLYLSPVMSYPQRTAPDEAAAVVKQAAAEGVEQLVAEHRRWWHDYWPASFVSIPDPRVEGFYWIQMFKYACAARADTGIIDTHGPWLQPTKWPYITWNLNTQISYPALQPANRLMLAEGLFRTLDANHAQLSRNVRPVEWQHDSAVLGQCSQQDLVCPLDDDMRYRRCFGNLLWVCHLYWLQYRFTMDESLLRERWLPLTRKAVNFYLHLLIEGEDGRIHLPESYSPEYHGTQPDTNYDLALLKWATGALIEACERLEIDDPLLPKWRDLQQRLVDYPTNENGFMVGRGTPFVRHRHPSHLLMIYPLYLANWEQADQRELIRTSIDHWQAGGGVGYTATVGSSMYSAIGDGNAALATFKKFDRFMFPNTMYAESGQNIESPLSGAQSINDMLVQSWGGKVRVFPAVPDAWPDAVIHDMRTEGAFLVSAVRRGGKTRWVRIRSLAGKPCVLKADMAEPLAVIGGADVAVTRVGDGEFAVALARGEEVVLAPRGAEADLSIKPLPIPDDAEYRFGRP